VITRVDFAENRMVEIVQEWIQAAGCQLYTRTWIPSVPVVATVLFIHGLGENIDRYDDMFKYFSDQGIQVKSFDQRGFGNTVRLNGLHGHNEGMATTFEDIKLVDSRSRIPGIPHFLFGHSMGGGLSLKYSLLNPEFQGVILSAPLVEAGKDTALMSIQKFAVRYLGQLLPSFVLYKPLSKSKD
jgi:acylglycerol lipase